MRSIISIRLCAALLALTLVSCGDKDGGESKQAEPAAMADTVYQRYAIKQGHIKYENSGLMRGSEELFFTDYGRREARYSDIEMLMPEGIRPQKVITITDGSMMIMADLSRNTGNRFREPFLDSLLRLREPDPVEKTVAKIMTDMGYTKKGTDTVLGKTSDVWFDQRSGTTMWLWGGVMLKQIVDNPEQKNRILAVSIDTVTPIDPSKFIAPTEIKYTEASPMAGRRQ